ncbi:MAG: hypothetical protein V2A66_03415 [Pseudomonadota bacterium]
MKVVRITMLVLALAMAVGSVLAMLPPDTFKDPIFASQDGSGDSGGSDSGGVTEFA